MRTIQSESAHARRHTAESDEEGWMTEEGLSAREFGAAFKGFLEQAVSDAPADDPFFLGKLRDHFGGDPSELPIVEQEFETTDRPNVQVALDAYLEPERRSAELL